MTLFSASTPDAGAVRSIVNVLETPGDSAFAPLSVATTRTV